MISKIRIIIPLHDHFSMHYNKIAYICIKKTHGVICSVTVAKRLLPNFVKYAKLLLPRLINMQSHSRKATRLLPNFVKYAEAQLGSVCYIAPARRSRY